MAQAFTLPPPPHAPRRHASRAQLHPSATIQPEPSVPSMPTQVVRESKPVQVSQPSTSKPIDTSSNADASSTPRQGRSFKRSLKAAFSRSAPSSPERTPVALPEFPSELATTVAFVKNKSTSSTKPAKKSKSSSKTKDTEIRYHAESKNHRPVTYQTAVELNMLLGGGSADYWLAQSRQTGEEDEGVGNGVEVGGIQDDSGQIWWDMQEKVEFTSLLPKDSQGAPVHHTDDMWVEFDNGQRRNSTSSSSVQSTISYLSSELEEISGSLFYGYGPGAPEMEPSRPHFTQQHATEATVLFPVEINGDESMSSELAVARSVISQANRQMYNKSAVVLADGFDDHFLSYESETHSKRINQQPAVQVAMVKATKTKSGGLLKNLWGSKQTVRD